jgi:hypothetical protein
MMTLDWIFFVDAEKWILGMMSSTDVEQKYATLRWREKNSNISKIKKLRCKT